MGKEVRMWEVGQGGLTAVEPDKLDKEARIEEWIKHDISVLDPALLVIGQQVETDFGKFIDLLCMDEEANLVIVELKRDKAPRDVTAQALEYAAWVEDLDAEETAAIAAEYFKKPGSEYPTLESAFAAKFRGAEVPEVVNSSHAIRIVASEITDDTERVIRYLSKSYGMDINAARFQLFIVDGRQLLVRTFTLAEDIARSNTSKQTGKRRRNLTPEEMEEIAEQVGVGPLYRQFEQALGQIFSTYTTQSTLSFKTSLPRGNLPEGRVVFNLVPGQSSKEEGLRYRVYLTHLAKFIDKDEEKIKGLLPKGGESWNPGYGNDVRGWAGYIRDEGDIHKIKGLVDGTATA